MQAKRLSKAALIVIALLNAISLINTAGREMKTIHIVEVSDSKKPVFPDSCVVCGHPREERLMPMVMSDEHSRVEFYFYKLSRTRAQGSLLEFPVHDSCAISARNGLIKNLTLIIIMAASIAVFGILSKFSLWASALAAIVVATPFLYMQFTKPVPVEFIHCDQKYVLMFKNRNYAEHVARLNNVEVKEGNHPYR